MQCEIQLLRVGGNSVFFFKYLVHAFQEISCTISCLCPQTHSLLSSILLPWLFQGLFRTGKGVLCHWLLHPSTQDKTHRRGGAGKKQSSMPKLQVSFSLLFSVNLQFFLFMQSLGANAAAVWLAHAQLLLIYKKAVYNSLYIKKHVAPAFVNGFLYLPTNLYCLKCNLKLSREIGSSYN